MQTKDFSKIFVRIYPEDGEATSRAAPTVTMIRLAPDGKELAPIPESAVIWRYMSLAKLVDLLSQRSLWL